MNGLIGGEMVNGQNEIHTPKKHYEWIDWKKTTRTPSMFFTNKYSGFLHICH